MRPPIFSAGLLAPCVKFVTSLGWCAVNQHHFGFDRFDKLWNFTTSSARGSLVKKRNRWLSWLLNDYLLWLMPKITLEITLGWRYTKHNVTASLWCRRSQLTNPSHTLLALFLKPTWHSALHAEQQEITLRSALVCWADLLPYCYLIIQEPWNVLVYGHMQPQSLCLPLMTAASQSFHLCMREFERTATHAHTYWCYLHTHNIANNNTSHLDFIHKVLNYGHRKSQTLQNTDKTSHYQF